MKTQRRFLTKQEAKKKYGKEWRWKISFHMDKKMDYLLGLPVPDEWIDGKVYTMHRFLSNNNEWYLYDKMTTTAPHPYEKMKLKIKVTPKQSEIVQKKVFAMGSGWSDGSKSVQYTGEPFLFLRYFELTWYESSKQDQTELTYNQFMNGTVPKKKEQVSNPTFKGYEVKPYQGAHINGYSTGCRKVNQHVINCFHHLCQQAKGYATPNEIYDFLEENKEFFNLK